MNKKKIFYIFLFVNAFLWSILGLFRNVIGDDALEAISWGELLDFGTNKHPPLSGWIMGGAYNLFQQHDFVAYFLGQACVLIGFIFIYKLSIKSSFTFFNKSTIILSDNFSISLIRGIIL